jgi:RHS repeat-associated protein
MDDATAKDNLYQDNGKELNNDFGLGWNDYGARWYDASVGRFPGIDPLCDTFNFVTPYNYSENEPVAHVDLWGLQKAVPKMQRIDKPSDIFSMKMVNNAAEGMKSIAREFFTEDVAKVTKQAGDYFGKVGVGLNALAPPAGVPLIGTGLGLEGLSYVQIYVDNKLDNKPISKETKTAFAVDALFEVLPRVIETPLKQSKIDNVAKEYVKGQIDLVNETAKTAVEQNIKPTETSNK